MTVSRIEVDFPAKELFVRLFGGDIYMVGGGVRDAVRGAFESGGDLDFCIVHRSVEAIRESLRPHGSVDLVGRSFGVIKFTRSGQTYDIALPRRDTPRPAERRSHKDFEITSDPELPIEEDLRRRDFRCNSMAARLRDGKILDPFGGQQDIARRLLRLTDPDAFPDDPLRVLRAARFAAVLEFSVAPEVHEAAKTVDLSGLSVERINEELFKILLDAPLPSIGLEELFVLGALRQLYPELFALTLSIQDSEFHPEKDRFGHHTVWQHTKITVDQAARLGRGAGMPPPRRLMLMLAALFHDVGKPEAASWEYKRDRMVITNLGHDIAGEARTREIFDRFKLYSFQGQSLRETVPLLIRCHHRASELWQNRSVVTKKAFNRLASDVHGEIELLIYLDAADRAGRDETPVTDLDEQGRWLIDKFHELNVSQATIQPLILGRDLIALGVEPGPNMGRILDRLYRMQLDNEFESREDGLKAARELVGEGVER
jgi:tRNA nucleotidyltransferase (CCA-adding enzyme)